MATIAVTVDETLRAAGTPSPQARSPVMAREMATLRGSIGARGFMQASARDGLKVTFRGTVGLRLSVAVSSGLAMRGRAYTGLPARVAERLAIGGRLTVKQRVVLREVLRLLGRGSPIATRYAFMRAGLALSDTTNLGRGVALRDHVRLQPRAAGVYRAVRAMVDRMELTATLGYKLVATVLVQDDVDLLGGTLLYALFHGHLQDTVDFILDVVNPGGDVTTWCMNARTNAVTEYLNYGFNAFATSGNGTYLAAGDDGLYELAGPDDAGTPVIADVVSGLADFSGIFLSGMQAAYLGIRGSGEFFLKLTSATGQSVTYGVKATSMRTARVNLGKGWRARFFTWELISTGQDFDLVDITFLPIQQTRRI